jgi:hypothetical protein
MTARPIHRDKVKGRVAALSGAALVHAALLAPLEMGARGLDIAPRAEWPSMLIHLEPRSTTGPLVVAPVTDSLFGAGPTIVHPLRLADAPRPDTALPKPPTAALADGATGIDSRWRVRPAGGGSGWGDCPDAIINPKAQHLCNERDRMRAAQAASRRAEVPLPSRVQPTDAPPNEALARAAAANQAWRDYTRDEGAYPGIISLLRDR